MVKGKTIVSLGEVKGLLCDDRDFLKELLQEVIQEVLAGQEPSIAGTVTGYG